MIIDMRVRPPIGVWTSKPQFHQGNYYPARAGFPRPPSALQQSIEMMVREMDDAEVQWGVISGRNAIEPLGVVPNDAVMEVMDRFPDRFLGFASVALDETAEQWIAEIARCFTHAGFKGLSIEPAAAPSPMHVDDRRLYPLYEYCSQQEIPISITMSIELVNLVSHPWEFASPMPLYQAARDFPSLQFVVAHGAWPYVQEILGLAYALPNVWVSPDLYMVGAEMPFAIEYVKAANLFLSDRTLFGTGYPSRPHVESVQAFKSWPFVAGVVDKVMYRNALRLMHMDSA